MRLTEYVCVTHATLQQPSKFGPELLAPVTACSHTAMSKPTGSTLGVCLPLSLGASMFLGSVIFS